MVILLPISGILCPVNEFTNSPLPAESFLTLRTEVPTSLDANHRREP